MGNQVPRSITEISDLYGKRVLVRASLDVPIKDGVVQNFFRIKRVLQTISYLIEQKAKVIILTHIGRDPHNSTRPLIEALSAYVPVSYVPNVIGDNVREAIDSMKEGTVILLENIRSHKEEEENDDTFARTLASYADIYVNDAFAVSHRRHASIVGIPKYVASYAGIAFVSEYTELTKAFRPQHPSLFILGGAKFETKAPLVNVYSEHYTHVCIGGAIANDFLKGKGYEVGESLLSSTDVGNSLLIKKPNILLPIDVVVAQGERRHVVQVADVSPHEKILDVGPATIEMLLPYIREARTILWNGPLGNYENGYKGATLACAEHIAKSDAYSIVGGGDTIAAIESLGVEDSFGFLSTAGGAMLEFLEKKTLPGIEALIT